MPRAGTIRTERMRTFFPAHGFRRGNRLVAFGSRATSMLVLVALLACAAALSQSEVTAAASPATPPFAWKIETADSSGNTGVHSSITLAGADTPYISYQDSANSEVLLAHRDGANWSSELVAGRGNFAGDTNVVVAPNNTIEVSYFDRAQRAIMYAAKGASGWATMRVDSGFSEGFNRLALNPLGNPCLVYTGFDGSLRYAAWNGAEWSIDVVDQTTVTSRYADLVFDALGRPHISYYGNGNLLYAERTSSGWSRVIVDSTPRAGLYSRIRLDSRGTPHIAYYASANASLMYATRWSVGWSAELVDGQGDAGVDLSFAIDRQDRAQIAYYSRIAGDLRFAIKADPRWIRETVDTGGVSGWYTGTAIDSRGLPHISYYDWTEGTLRQAEGAIALQVRTLTASQVDPSSATLRGELVALGIHPGVAVEFALYPVNGPDTVYRAGNLTAAGGFSLVVRNLTTDMMYGFRAVGIAGNETAQGSTVSFRLASAPPPSPPYALFIGTGIAAIVGVTILVLAVRRRKRPPSPGSPIR